MKETPTGGNMVRIFKGTDMERISIFFAASMMVFAAGCQKGYEDNDAAVSGEASEVVLTANLPDTKTTLEEGYKVSWNKNDQIAVFNAPAGTADYSGNLHFYIDENAEGLFSAGEGTEVPFEEGVNYDWYVCSPWRATNGTAELVTPKGQGKDDGYFPIGAQTQTGYNSSVHISGTDIMVGKALNTRTPIVALKHLAVLHKFTVTNKSDKPTVINKLTFNGGDNKLFGTFWIDLTADNPAIDVTKANATFNERALTVKNGTELPVGESADFYLMTAPFTLNTGETFKVTIETSTGTQVVEKTATKDIVFAAGTYNTAELEYNLVSEKVDWLYKETFGINSSLPTSGTASTQFTDNTMNTRWEAYLADRSGLSVFDGEKNAISYEWKNVQLSAQVSASAIKGMEGTYLWFKDKVDSQLTISGIKLHYTTELTLSFIQTYNASAVKVEYSIDNGQTWKELGTTTNSSADAVVRSFDFSVPAESETISIRLTRVDKALRLDTIKLTWQEL